jgi:hypothetical protein
MSNDSKEAVYKQPEVAGGYSSSALKVGLISVASAIVGGLAAAWWYRKTITRLQNPIAGTGDHGGEPSTANAPDGEWIDPQI